MITTINNYTNKSFKNYTGPTDIPFKKKNVFFGYNGKGKSALSIGILQEFKKDKSYTEDNYRFFNKDYIKENLLLKDSNSIKGVVANFGKDNVDIEKEIEIKINSLKDLSSLEKKKTESENIINTEINNVFARRKGNSLIKKKTGINIEEILKAYEKDLEPAKKIVNSVDELKNIKDSAEYEKELKQLKNVKIIEIVCPTDNELKLLNNIMNNEYNESEIPSAVVLSWLQKGIDIHKDSNASNCKFCGSPIHLEDIEKKVKMFLEDKKQQDLLELNKIYNIIVDITSRKSEINENKILFSKILSDNIVKYYENIESSIDKLSEIVKKIKSKIDSFEKKISYDNFSLIEAINNIKNNLLLISQFKNEHEEMLSTSINKNNTLLKGAIALDLNNNSLIQNELKHLNDTNKLIKEYTNFNKQIKEEINRLKRSKSATNDFAEFINELLENLGIDFYLDIKNNDYIIRHKLDKVTLTINEISEGENNLLALLLFYYELFNDKLQQNYKTDINLIIIDDPISSVDDINKIYVLEIIKKILIINEPQVFIFTHVWEDFVNICYGKKDIDKKGHETPYRFYEIKKNNNGSYIKKVKYNETPYMHDFKEIYEFSQLDSIDDWDECEIYHYPNVMRKVLEKFMEFKVSNSSPTLENIDNVTIALCNNVNNASHKDKIEIPALLDVCNIMSHKFSRNPEQVLKSAKYLMRKIQSADVNHFSKMTN